MVKNREELLYVAQENANQLKTNLRAAVSDFLRMQKVTPDELAYVLGITTNEMKQILEGNGNITVDALSKLLVATDMAVEIKPVRNTPLGSYGRKMPSSGGYPSPNGMPVGPGGIPVGPDGRPLPPPPGFPGMFPGRTPQMGGAPSERVEEVPMETNAPARDAHGRFVRKTATQRKPATSQRKPVTGNPYTNVNDAELVNIIRQNIWDGEIDVNHATHEELAAFVANKERIMRERTENPTMEQARAQQNMHSVEREELNPNGGSQINQFLEMLGNIAKEAENNPQLAETIARFMPRK